MAYQTWYARGDWNVLDDLSGFRLKHSRARKIPGGQTGNLLVDRKRWEAQHPQDFVRGVIDDQTIPPTEMRPRQTNHFVLVGTWVVKFSPRLSNVITVDSVEGFELNDRVLVMTDCGENYYATIAALVDHMMYLTPNEL